MCVKARVFFFRADAIVNNFKLEGKLFLYYSEQTRRHNEARLGHIFDERHSVIGHLHRKLARIELWAHGHIINKEIFKIQAHNFTLRGQRVFILMISEKQLV